jgi:hypothetical protein
MWKTFSVTSASLPELPGASTIRVVELPPRHRLADLVREAKHVRAEARMLRAMAIAERRALASLRREAERKGRASS